MQTKNSIMDTISVNQDELESSNEDDESDVEIDEDEDDVSDDSNDEDDDNDEEDDDDDNEDETNIADKVKSSTITQKTKSGGKHIVFDDDEDFENLPIPDSLASGPGPGFEDLDDSDSDSDAAPEEVVTTAALKATIKQEKKIKEETEKARLSLRDARKKTHQRNKEQKEEKRQRLKVLESERLPEELLAAVEAEKAQKPEKRKVAIEKHEGKIKRFKNSKEETGTGSDRGVQVKAVIKEMKKYSSVIAKAADFRQQQLYGSDVVRRPSKDARMLKEKLIKGGKHKLVT